MKRTKNACLLPAPFACGKFAMVAVLVLLAGDAWAADIQSAGTLFVNLQASDPSSSTESWKNTGSLGDFVKIGQPTAVDIDGVKAVMLNSGESNDAWQCKDVAPVGLVGKSPTRSVEVWVYNPDIAVEEPMVAWSRRGGPPGSAYGFNYGTAPGHGALTHWGGGDLGWGQVPEAGKWHYLVHTSDGRTNRVYSDAREIASETLRPRDIQLHSGGRVTLGTALRADDQPEFQSLRSSLALAIVRVHDGVLSEEQIVNNFLVDSVRLGINHDPGRMRFTAVPASESFTIVDGQWVYAAEVEVRGLPLPSLEVKSPKGATLERVSAERHRLTWRLKTKTSNRIAVNIIATNDREEIEASWAVRVAPLVFKTKMLSVDTNECCDIADVDNDGQLDIIAGRAWYAAPDLLPRPLRAIGEFGKDYSANNGDHAFDVNGDGWVDVIAGGFQETEVYWYENPGAEGLEFGKQWTAHLMTDTKERENELTFFHDLDRDGTPEYIVNSWNPNRAMLGWKLRVGDDKSVGLQKLEFGPAGQNHNGHGMGFGDVNGDGRDDIVFESGWYEHPAEGAFETNWPLHADWSHPGSSCPILVRDLNNDGLNDMILGRGHDYGLFWFEQLKPGDNGKTRWREHLIDKSFSQLHVLHWVDLDGDGSDELVTGKRVRAHSGSDPGAADIPEMYFYRWDRSREMFTRYTLSSGRVGTGLQIRDSDMNGDGRTDIVVSGKSGTFVLFNQGPPKESD
jgi:hypothetical protein